jgi:hypothetical protein
MSPAQLQRAENVALAWAALGHTNRMHVRSRWPGLGTRLDNLTNAELPSEATYRIYVDHAITTWTTSPELRVHVGATWPTLAATLHRLATAT